MNDIKQLQRSKKRVSFFRNTVSALAFCAASSFTFANTDVSHLVTYQAATSSQSLLDSVQGRGDEFLQSVQSKGNPPFCSLTKRSGLTIFQTLLKFVPGVGEIPDLVNLATQSAIVATCRNGGGVQYTWDDIMDAVDQKIEIAFTKEQRQQMRDLFGHFTLEFDSRVDRILRANDEELSQDDILLLITELQNIIADIEIAETQFGTGEHWSQHEYLSRIYGLKYSIHLVLDKLFNLHGDLEAAAFDHANLQMEQTRVRALLSLKKSGDAFRLLVDSSNYLDMRYHFKKLRKGFMSHWRRRFTVNFFSPDGQKIVDYHSSCNGNPCGGISAKTWYKRRDRMLRSLVADYKKTWADVFATRDENYRDFTDSLNYFKGQQLFLVSKEDHRRGYLCLQPADSTAQPTLLESARCSFRTPSSTSTRSLNNITIFERDNVSDSWRVHEKTGLLIHEASGLCLDLADDKTEPQLSACQYNLDPEREENSTQEWAIYETEVAGYLVNRNTNECLNTPHEGSRVEMQACDTTRMKKRTLKMGVENIEHKPDQFWSTYHLNNCEDFGGCRLAKGIQPVVPTRLADATKRLVLPADAIDIFENNAFLDSNEFGFSDTGFLSLTKHNDQAVWSDLELLAGRYKVSIFYKGLPRDAAEKMRLKMHINGKPLTDGEFLPVLAIGQVGSDDFYVDVPEFGHTFAISSDSDGGKVLIDRVVFTPIAE